MPSPALDRTVHSTMYTMRALGCERTAERPTSLPYGNGELGNTVL